MLVHKGQMLLVQCRLTRGHAPRPMVTCLPAAALLAKTEVTLQTCSCMKACLPWSAAKVCIAREAYLPKKDSILAQLAHGRRASPSAAAAAGACGRALPVGVEVLPGCVLLLEARVQELDLGRLGGAAARQWLPTDHTLSRGVRQFCPCLVNSRQQSLQSLHT